MNPENKPGRVSTISRSVAAVALFLAGCAPDSRTVVVADVSPSSKLADKVIKGDDFTIERYSKDAFLIYAGAQITGKGSINYQRAFQYIDARCRILGVAQSFGKETTYNEIVIVDDGECLSELK